MIRDESWEYRLPRVEWTLNTSLGLRGGLYVKVSCGWLCDSLRICEHLLTSSAGKDASEKIALSPLVFNLKRCVIEEKREVIGC